MTTFSAVAVIDERGWILMQERDEHAPVDPNLWGLPGGGLEVGEDHLAAAVRELVEETGLKVEPEELTSLGITRFFCEPCATEDEFELFVVVLDVTDADVTCGEGRQMVFVDPATLGDLALNHASGLALPLVRSWAPYAEAHGVRDEGQRCFAGIILVDPRGRILLQERDEHAPIDPETWGLAGGHVDPGESFEAAAYRELEEETGIRLGPGELDLFDEFTVDHREAYGTWDRMQVFVAATTLTDADIECHEGRQIIFVDPTRARQLALSHAAADIVPAFLDSAHHPRLAGATR